MGSCRVDFKAGGRVMRAIDDGQAFWGFALSAYAREGVAAECLALQDRHGACVMLLLFLCWRATQCMTLDAAALREAGLRIAVHERHLGAPLRAARRALAAPARGDWPWLQQARARLGAVELASERLQARALAAVAHTAPAPDDARALAREMLGAYLGTLWPVPAPDTAARLADCVLAAVPYPPG
jgi:uncharacterized protein (TIGR02444 family)